ncbi:hypothetical protein FRC09_016301, partial [Ceratobasidium sp. 395]
MNERWGPPFVEYSTRNFDPRPSDLSEDDSSNFHYPGRTPSVDLLEFRLHKGDPRRTDGGFMSFRSIFDAMAHYSMATECHLN